MSAKTDGYASQQQPRRQYGASPVSQGENQSSCGQCSNNGANWYDERRLSCCFWEDHQQEHHAQARTGVDAHGIRAGQVVSCDPLQDNARNGNAGPDQNAQYQPRQPHLEYNKTSPLVSPAGKGVPYIAQRQPTCPKNEAGHCGSRHCQDQRQKYGHGTVPISVHHKDFPRGASFRRLMR